MRRLMKDNRGMTLIELLIAITILGLVVAPLLHGFLTSAQTEVKARKMGEVTSVAQNVMEVVEGNKFADVVVEQITDTYKIFKTDTNNTVEAQYYSVVEGYEAYGVSRPTAEDYHIGLKKFEVAGKQYNVMIDIAASRYEQVNSREKLSVNSKMSKVFSIDKTDVSADSRIIIDVTPITADGKDKIKYSVSHVLGAGTASTSVDYFYEIPENDDTAAIYLMYYPSYKKAESGTGYTYAKDIIEINNLKDVEFDLYLIKQKDSNFTEEELAAVEEYYVCNIIQNLSGTYTSANSISGATIYSNVKDNLGDDTKFIPNTNITYKIMCGSSQGIELIGDVLPFQTESEARRRIYQVTVKVYDKDTDFTGEPLGTLNGAILK